MGLLPTVFMGERLMTVLGKDACVRLKKEAHRRFHGDTGGVALLCASGRLLCNAPWGGNKQAGLGAVVAGDQDDG